MNLRNTQRTNSAILDKFVEDDVFTKRNWSDKEDALVFNISIFGNYKRAELT